MATKMVWFRISLVMPYGEKYYVIIGSSNGLSPVWHQAITYTNADLLSTWPVGINLGEIQIKI